MTPVALKLYKGGQIDINAICSNKDIYIIRNEETHTRALLHFARGESKRLGCKKKHRSSWNVRTDRALHTPRMKGPSRTKRAEFDLKRSIEMTKLLSGRSICRIALRWHPLKPKINVTFLFKTDEFLEDARSNSFSTPSD